MAKLTDKIGAKKALEKPRQGVLWKGPESADKNGGVTFSLLSRFLVCRERFRLHVIEGLRPRDTFNAKIEYGSMWHEAEEAFAKGDNANHSWKDAALSYARKLAEKYPFSREEIDHWLQKLYLQFPLYVEYWKRHPDTMMGEPLAQEQVFDVLYTLPSGRKVRLRGKRDRLDVVNRSHVWTQENKTKSQIDVQKLTRQLSCDLQSMLYMVALHEGRYQKPLIDILPKGSVLAGVRYNVIRRSAHKTAESMHKKMTEDIADNRGGEWFSRWNVDITASDIERFKQRTLNPILEQLCYWWDHINYTVGKGDPPHYCSPAIANDLFLHWRHPYGVYNVLDEGGSSDLDAYLETGSEAGLTRVSNLFTELQDE